MIDKDALWAIRKIQGVGGEAYIVGGAIRDIMLGNTPKDFDISTSLSPRQVQRLFWNSRIIGRRFRIVHLFFGEKIIEVTTFRSDEENFEEGNNNVFGTIEQDARRRDFSINALYYNPAKCEILDFGKSMEDFQNKVIRSLIPLRYSFSEDPVRMLRAVKYHVTTGFRFRLDVAWAIRRNAPNLMGCPASRLTEEVVKILSSGHSQEIFSTMYRYKLLQYLLPAYAVHSQLDAVKESLKELDAKVMEAIQEGTAKPSKGEMFYYMMKPAIIVDTTVPLKREEYIKDAFRQAKVMLSPITPANQDLEKAVELVLVDKGIKVQKKKKKAKGLPGTSAAPEATQPKNPKVRKRRPRKRKPSIEQGTQSPSGENKSLAEPTV